MRLRSLAVAAVLIVALLPSGVQARDRYCAGRKATIVGGPGRDRLRGTDHRDVIVGLGGNDTIHGRDGWDIICGGPGRDELHGDVGDDVLDGDRGSDLLVGDRGNDHLGGDEDADELRGGAGNDRFPAGMDPGRDLIDGGASEDLINMAVTEPNEGEPDDATGPATVDLAAGFARGPDGGSDRITGIENVYGTGMGDELYGDDGPNVLNAGYYGGGMLDGRGGNDTLTTGQDGDTTFIGGPGDDLINPLESNQIDGGEGSDTLSFCGPYAASSADVMVDLDAGRSEAQHRDESAAVNELVSVENAQSCDGDDQLYGDEGNNHLDAGPGTDSIDGRDGVDTCVKGEETANCEA